MLSRLGGRMKVIWRRGLISGEPTRSVEVGPNASKRREIMVMLVVKAAMGRNVWAVVERNARAL